MYIGTVAAGATNYALYSNAAAQSYFASNVGIGNSTPNSQFYVTRPLTLGVTGKALAIFDQIENQDILTASAGGVTKFTIKNDGTASSSAGFTINGVGNIQSTNNQTLTLGGSTTGDIIIAPRNGNGILSINSPTISTNQSTVNLLNATATVVNFAGAATTLELGSATGTTNVNNALLVDLAAQLSTTLSVGGARSASGYPGSSAVDFGTTQIWSSDSVTDFNSKVPTLTLMNSNTTANNLTEIVFASNNSGATNVGYAAIVGIAGTRTASFYPGALAFYTGGASIANTERMRLDSTGLGIGTTSPISQLHLTRPLSFGATGKALAIFDQIENQDILAASSSGITRFVIKNDGTASSSAGFTINGAGNLATTNNQTLTIGGSTTGNITLSPLNGSGTVTINGTLAAKTSGGATIVVAAVDSSAKGKLQADYVGDGTDDDVTIETAIAALPATGGTVVLLDGTYSIGDGAGDGIDITKSNVTITGAGRSTVLQRQGDTASNDGVITVGNGSTAYSGVVISNLFIDGQETLYSGIQNVGILFTTDITQSTITNTWIDRNDGYGIYFLGSASDTANNNITGNVITNNDAVGIQISDSSHNRITNNHIEGNAGDGGVSIASSSNYNIIEGNNISSNSNYGILVASGTYNSVLSNTFNSSSNITIFLLSDNNTINGNTIISSGHVSIDIQSDKNTITGNNIISSTNSGISMSGADSNTITGNNINEVGAGLDGIYMAGSDNNIISGNKITDTSGASSQGIDIDNSTSDNNYLAANEISGVFTVDVEDSGTGTIIQHRDTFAINGTNPIGHVFDLAGQSVGKSLFNLNYTGSGQDIFTASASGTNVFRLTNTGVASASGGFTINGAGNIQSALGQTLTIGGGTSGNLVIGQTGKDILFGSSTFANCTALETVGGILGCGTDDLGGGAAANFWQYDSSTGIVANGNLTTDLLLGGTSTASAKFAFIGVAGTDTPVASVSATSGSNATKGIYLSGDGSLQSVRNNTLTIGGSTTGDISFKPGNSSSSLYLASSGNIGIGTTVPGAALDVVGSLLLGANSTIDTRASGTLSIGTAANTTGLTLGRSGNTTTFNSTTWTATPTISGLITGTLGVSIATGQSYTGAGTVTLSSASNNDLTLTAAGSGNLIVTSDSDTGLRIGNNAVPATLFVGGGIGSNAGFILNRVGSTDDILAASASGTTRFVIKNDGTASSSAGFTIDAVGNIQSTLNQTLTIGGGTTGDLVIGRTSQTTYLPGFTTNNNSVLYTGVSGQLSATTTTSSGLCLTSNGTNAAPSWGSCAGGVTVWDTGNGTIRPGNTTFDFLAGGISSSSAGFRVTGQGNPFAGTQATASVSGATSNAALIVDNRGVGDIFTASSSGLSRFVIRQNGNVGIGTSTPTEKLDVNGNIQIRAQNGTLSHTFQSGCNCLLNSSSGTFGAESSVVAATSSAVWRGKLFISTNKPNEAGVYRYDGGTTWTLVTNSTPGKAISGDTANIDQFVMTVYNDKLYIGSQTGVGTNLGAVYVSSNADTTADGFTLVNATRGTFTLANNDGISDLVVYKGSLYVGTQEPNLAEVTRYDGGTTFTQVSNTTEGRIGTVASTTVDGVKFAVFQGRLFAANLTGPAGAAARVAVYSGVGTAWVDLNATAGTFGADTAIDDASGIAVWNGSLYVATGDPNLANVYRWEPPGTFSVDTTVTNWKKVNNTSGKVIAGDATNIDSIILKTYNGKLYAGTQTQAGEDTAALYEYDGVAGSWTLINTTRGTFNAQTGMNDVSVIQEYNGTMYVGTGDGANGTGSMYSWSKTLGSSYALKFDSGGSNFATVTFSTGSGQFTNNSNGGSFIMSHGLMTSAGAYDVAEDYPTRDETLRPGDIVEVDPNEKGYVRRSTSAYAHGLLGVYSEKPGFRLSQKGDSIDGSPVIPVALAGRVPVSVSTENGAVEAGDYLTSSSIPGVAMKATKAGNVIGKALEPFDSSETGKILVYVNSSQAIGDISGGIFAQSGMGNVGADLNSNFNTFLNVDGNFAGKIRENRAGGTTYTTSSTGYAEWYKQADLDEELENGDIVCMSSTGVAKCNDNGTILGVITDIPGFEGNSQHANEEGYVLVGISGQILTKTTGDITKADSIGVSDDAGVGTKKELGYILGTAVESLDSTGSESAVLVSINPTYKIDTLSMGATLNAPSSAPEPSNYTSGQEFTNLAGRITNLEQLAYENRDSVEKITADMASISARLNKLEEFRNVTLAPFANSSNPVTTADELLVSGTGSFNSAVIQETLNIGSSMRVTATSIDTIGTDLAIQSLKQGKLDLMSGALVIDTTGKISINEDAEFAKDVTVKGVLSAQSIAIQKGDYLELSATEASSSATAGKSSIKVGQTFRKILNPNVKSNSLIYVTPTSRTVGTTPFVSEQVDEQYFRVEIENAIENNLEFNFLIISQ